jgi:hypothetical protein
VGESGATISPALAQKPTIVLAMGAPRMHVANVLVLGGLHVTGSELQLTNCTIVSLRPAIDLDDVSTLSVQRALSIVGGHAVLTRVVLSGHSAGAISVNAATLTLIECTLRENWAQVGGAMLVIGGANVTAERSVFVQNSASVSGGAIQVQCYNRIVAQMVGEDGETP